MLLAGDYGLLNVSAQDLKTKAGPAFVYRENNARFIGIKFSVRGCDLGNIITEVQKTVVRLMLPAIFNLVYGRKHRRKEGKAKVKSAVA
jgi:Cu/Ag efflux pump CusA